LQEEFRVPYEMATRSATVDLIVKQ